MYQILTSLPLHFTPNPPAPQNDILEAIPDHHIIIFLLKQALPGRQARANRLSGNA
jgi:hypothetical protein